MPHYVVAGSKPWLGVRRQARIRASFHGCLGFHSPTEPLEGCGAEDLVRAGVAVIKTESFRRCMVTTVMTTTIMTEPEERWLCWRCVTIRVCMCWRAVVKCLKGPSGSNFEWPSRVPYPNQVFEGRGLVRGNARALAQQLHHGVDMIHVHSCNVPEYAVAALVDGGLVIVEGLTCDSPAAFRKFMTQAQAIGAVAVGRRIAVIIKAGTYHRNERRALWPHKAKGRDSREDNDL